MTIEVGDEKSGVKERISVIKIESKRVDSKQIVEEISFVEKVENFWTISRNILNILKKLWEKIEKIGEAANTKIEAIIKN